MELELEDLRKLSTDQTKDHEFQVETLLSEKRSLQTSLDASRDLIRELESELDLRRTSNLEEKLHQADPEALGLRRDVDQMRNRIERASESLNLALNSGLTCDERREMNRSLEGAIAEVQLLCQEVSGRSSKRYVERGTCMASLEVFHVLISLII